MGDSLNSFREATFLLCTDLASRGLDILKVQSVVNFDAPCEFNNYIHRIGRAARTSNSGRALTIIEDSDRALLKQIIKQRKSAIIQTCVVPPNQILINQLLLDSLQTPFKRILKQDLTYRN